MKRATIPVCEVCNKQVLFNRFSTTNTISLFKDGVDLGEIEADNLDNFCSCGILNRKIKYIKTKPEYNNKVKIDNSLFAVYKGYFVDIDLNDSTIEYVNCRCGGVLIDVIDTRAKNHYIWCEKCGKSHFVNRLTDEEIKQHKENSFCLVKDLNDEIDNIETEGFETENDELNILNETDNVEENSKEFSNIFGNEPLGKNCNTLSSFDATYNDSIKQVNLKHILIGNIDNKYFINNRDILAYSILGIKLGYHNEIMTNIINHTCKTDFDISSIMEYEFKILNSDAINVINTNMLRYSDIIVLTKLIQVIKRDTDCEEKYIVIGYILVEQKVDLNNRTISKYTLSEVSKFTVEKSLKMKNAASICKAYTKINSRGLFHSHYDTLERLELPKFGSKQGRENRSLKVCPACRKSTCECN